MSSLTWEAFRLTSKSPSEVLHVLGPHGVDDLIRKAMDALWREYPESSRSYDTVKKRFVEVCRRNLEHWATIRKPSPQAFFADLLPYTADGHVRQALVLAWMMLPRAGGRDFQRVGRIVEQIVQRNLSAWEQDHRTFTAPRSKATPAARQRTRKSSARTAKSKPKKTISTKKKTKKK